MSKLIFNFLKAFNGDCIHISFMDETNTKRNILIDGGVGLTYSGTDKRSKKSFDGELKLLISEIKENNEIIDLLILTHIDDDHIGGLLKWFSEDKTAIDLIMEVWYNSGKKIHEWFNIHKNEQIKENKELDNYYFPSSTLFLSQRQGILFENIVDKKISKLIIQGDLLERFGLQFYILSPDDNKLHNFYKYYVKEKSIGFLSGKRNDYSMSIKEHIKHDVYNADDKYSNGSSIAFALNYQGKNWLFLGDAFAETIVEGLKLCYQISNFTPKFEFVKISHHGSSKNTNYDLLKYIDCNNFVISTNGIIHNHPEKRLISRIINQFDKSNIYFNYFELTSKIFNQQDQIDFSNIGLFDSQDINKNICLT